MAVTLEDVINSRVSEEEMGTVKRTFGVKERPKGFVELKSLTRDVVEEKRINGKATADLIVLEQGVLSSLELLYEVAGKSGYLIWCADTYEMWYAPTQLCLDSNFIYRDDLEIKPIGVNDAELLEWYNSKVEGHNYGIVTCKKCYILDNPACETYEVYYNSNYPSLHYGVATPKGCTVHSYANRFQRDIAILELDELYSNTSNKEAGKLITKPMAENEAIIISDGAWIKGTCACAYVYLDNKAVVKNVEGVVPTDTEQAILIGELLGAFNALMLCYVRKKTNITYYYDNTNVPLLFKNKKLSAIPEVVEYKKLLIMMHNEGYNVTFVEIHPKTGENKAEENKALMFFHYQCDFACREIADIFKKNYKAFATNGSKDGLTYNQLNKSNSAGNRVKPKEQGINNTKKQRNYKDYKYYGKSKQNIHKGKDD